MIICSCRRVSHHTVKETLTSFFQGVFIRTSRSHPDNHVNDAPNLDDLHQACSGQGFNCGKCECNWADAARDHNRAITMNQLIGNLPSRTDVPSEQAPAKRVVETTVCP